MQPSTCNLQPLLTLRPFRPDDQPAVKALILAGLEEHWGTLDPTLNPDLDDIRVTYAEATFLVAEEPAEAAEIRDVKSRVKSHESRDPDDDSRLLTFDPHTAPTSASRPRIIGTGALKPHGDGGDTGEIVRMSVARDARRRGIGRRILNALIADARERGYARIILETTQTWAGAVTFYLSAGFQITHYQDGDVYFVLELRGPS